MCSTALLSSDVARFTTDVLDDTSPFIVLTWDKERIDEVEAAKKQFDQYIKRGWLAFAVRADNIPRQIFNFDSSSERIILTPIVKGG